MVVVLALWLNKKFLFGKFGFFFLLEIFLHRTISFRLLFGGRFFGLVYSWRLDFLIGGGFFEGLFSFGIVGCLSDGWVERCFGWNFIFQWLFDFIGQVFTHVQALELLRVQLTIHLAIRHYSIWWNKSQIPLNLILIIFPGHLPRIVDHHLYDLFWLVVLFDIDTEELNKELFEVSPIVLPNQDWWIK